LRKKGLAFREKGNSCSVAKKKKNLQNETSKRQRREKRREKELDHVVRPGFLPMPSKKVADRNGTEEEELQVGLEKNATTAEEKARE